jgi:pimeloyl-ACP methyl ester carboxylesterase
MANAEALDATNAARNVREYLGMTGSLMHHDTGTATNGAGMATKKRQAASAPVRLRRMYIDCRYGQLHLTTAYPSSGGFDEASPIVFLHADEGSGADFSRCAAILAADRSIYAPDLPGNGGSDSPKGRMAVAGLALAIADLFDQLRLRRVDLVGCGRGALVAFELAASRPREVRRLVIAGTQQPSTAIAQPMLQLSPDPARVLQEPAESVVHEIRAFLDRV